MTGQAPPHLPRAPRFALPVSILYRPAGDYRWRAGRAENISQSGVLFRGTEPVDLEVPVEILMEMPAEVAGSAAGSSLCRGRIVRLAPDRSDAPGFAAAISEWEVLQLDPRRV